MLTNLYDNARSANNPYETVLTPAVVASSAFGLLGSYVVEGAVYSQVLIMTNVAFQMPNGTPIRYCMHLPQQVLHLITPNTCVRSCFRYCMPVLVLVCIVQAATVEGLRVVEHGAG